MPITNNPDRIRLIGKVTYYDVNRHHAFVATSWYGTNSTPDRIEAGLFLKDTRTDWIDPSVELSSCVGSWITFEFVAQPNHPKRDAATRAKRFGVSESDYELLQKYEKTNAVISYRQDNCWHNEYIYRTLMMAFFSDGLPEVKEAKKRYIRKRFGKNTEQVLNEIAFYVNDSNYEESFYELIIELPIDLQKSVIHYAFLQPNDNLINKLFHVLGEAIDPQLLEFIIGEFDKMSTDKVWLASMRTFYVNLFNSDARQQIIKHYICKKIEQSSIQSLGYFLEQYCEDDFLKEILLQAVVEGICESRGHMRACCEELIKKSIRDINGNLFSDILEYVDKETILNEDESLLDFSFGVIQNFYDNDSNGCFAFLDSLKLESLEKLYADSSVDYPAVDIYLYSKTHNILLLKNDNIIEYFARDTQDNDGKVFMSFLEELEGADKEDFFSYLQSNEYTTALMSFIIFITTGNIEFIENRDISCSDWLLKDDLRRIPLFISAVIASQAIQLITPFVLDCKARNRSTTIGLNSAPVRTRIEGETVVRYAYKLQRFDAQQELDIESQEKGISLFTYDVNNTNDSIRPFSHYVDFILLCQETAGFSELSDLQIRVWNEALSVLSREVILQEVLCFLFVGFYNTLEDEERHSFIAALFSQPVILKWIPIHFFANFSAADESVSAIRDKLIEYEWIQEKTDIGKLLLLSGDRAIDISCVSPEFLLKTIEQNIRSTHIKDFVSQIGLKNLMDKCASGELDLSSDTIDVLANLSPEEFIEYADRLLQEPDKCYHKYSFYKYVYKARDDYRYICNDIVVNEWNRILNSDPTSLSPDVFQQLLNPNDIDLISSFLYDSPYTSDKLCLAFYICYQTPRLKERIIDISTYYEWWIAFDLSSFLYDLINERIIIDASDLQRYIENTDINSTSRVISKFPYIQQRQVLEHLPIDLAISIAHDYLRGADVFLKEKVIELMQQSANIVVFDMEANPEEEDPKKIVSAYAFLHKGSLQAYDNIEQLKRLIRRLKCADIIVGHNIKYHDLRILKSYEFLLPPECYLWEGNKVNSSRPPFIWDTMEMEMLINPCRFSYSLYTTHSAEDDTRTTANLFWSQIYRLARNPLLRAELSQGGFLPSSIDDLIAVFGKTELEDFFSFDKTGDEYLHQRTFFNPETVDRLSKILEKENPLIVAPKDIWRDLSQIVQLRFPHDNQDISYKIFSYNALVEYGFSQPFKKDYLNRYVDESITPIVANIPDFLCCDEPRNPDKVYFDEKEIAELTIDADQGFDCIDIDAFQDDNILEKRYSAIYFVGDEIQDRVHAITICGTPMTYSKLTALGSSIPLRLSSSGNNITRIDEHEIAKLGLPDTEDATCVWAERNLDGGVVFYKNISYQQSKDELIRHLGVAKDNVYNLPWVAQNSRSKPIIARSGHFGKAFDFSSKRVTSISAKRNAYWTYQMKILSAVNGSRGMSSVLIIDDINEVHLLEEYARKLGYYVPGREGESLIRRLEMSITKGATGLCICDQKEFRALVKNKIKAPVCFYWDSLNVEKYSLLWSSLSFDGEDENDAPVFEQDFSNKLSTENCITRFWPIITYYNNLIQSNNPDCILCVMDSHFDDFRGTPMPDIQCEDMPCNDLWGSENDYLKDIEDALTFFHDEPIDDAEIDNTAKDESKRLIKESLINNFSQWRDHQERIVEYIASRSGDSFVTLPTGSGKSVLFQGPALYRSIRSRRLSLVITPLKALMLDQVKSLMDKGFVGDVEYLNEDRTDGEIREIYRVVRSGGYAILYVTPERFRSEGFMDVLYQRMYDYNGLEYVVFDEAHCISLWGEDFRPDYRYALQRCIELREAESAPTHKFRIAFFSATITSLIREDIESFFKGEKLTCMPEQTFKIPENIKLVYKRVPDNYGITERAKEIVSFIRDHKYCPDSQDKMVIFCMERWQCEELAETLDGEFQKPENSIIAGFTGRVGFFHAGLEFSSRDVTYRRFSCRDNTSLLILCATKAFGMGMDIDNIHYIIHYNPSSVIEDYVQEIGRGGRDKANTQALCLYSDLDFGKYKKHLAGRLKWSDIEDVRKRLYDFFVKHKKSEIDSPDANKIVVPFDIWVSQESDASVPDTVQTRTAFDWLERMGKIRQDYVRQVYLEIELHDKIIDEDAPRNEKDLLDFLNTLSTLTNKSILFNIKKYTQSSKMPRHKVVGVLLSLQRQGFLTIKETLSCAFTRRRYLEAHYTARTQENLYTIRLICSGLQKLLSGKKVIEVGPADIKRICRSLIPESSFQEQYMPWRNEAQFIEDFKESRGAVTKSSTFKNDIIEYTGRKLFVIAQYLPGVSVKTIYREGELGYKITIRGKEYGHFLKDLERDCLWWITVVSKTRGPIIWSDEIINKKGLDNKGFRYFETIMSVLNCLSYVKSSPIFRTGIEITPQDSLSIEIGKGIDANSPEFKFRNMFENRLNTYISKMHLMNMFVLLPEDMRAGFLDMYSNCNGLEGPRGYLKLMEDTAKISDQLKQVLLKYNEEAYNKEKDKLNPEQLRVLNMDFDKNINIVAGPGAGKTHMLIMRCASIIREQLSSDNMLVLAYNRSVVVELNMRLQKLFAECGFGGISRGLKPLTFHSLFKKILKDSVFGNDSYLDNAPEKWETQIKELLGDSKKRGLLKVALGKLFQHIKYVFIDEFQDVNQVRLDVVFLLKEIFSDEGITFFIIGDINQSIYGFNRTAGISLSNNLDGDTEYARVFSPDGYYDNLKKILSPIESQLKTNYRSYQSILKYASKHYLPEGAIMPETDEQLQAHEREKVSWHEYNADTEQWLDKIPDIITWAQEENLSEDPYRKVSTIAILFRTNPEVYLGYTQLRPRVIGKKDILIRIQGTDMTELWRQREIYLVIDYCCNQHDANEKLDRKEDFEAIKNLLKNRIDEGIWDAYLLDIAITLVRCFEEDTKYLDTELRYQDLADYVKDIAGKDDGGQLYKLYDDNPSYHVLHNEGKISIVLSTMHKVKGLQFDVVVITPSDSCLPFSLEYPGDRKRRDITNRYTIDGQSISAKTPDGSKMWPADMADIEEEKRLFYVACTRARKRLDVFKGERERRIEKGEYYISANQNANLIYERKIEIEDYDISSFYKNECDELINRLKRDTPITIYGYNNGYGYRVVFKLGEQIIGKLGAKSDVRKMMEDGRIRELSDSFYVNDILVWEKEDTFSLEDANILSTYENSLSEYNRGLIPKPSSPRNLDKLRERKQYYDAWNNVSKARAEKKFVYIVTIYGMGIITDTNNE